MSLHVACCLYLALFLIGLSSSDDDEDCSYKSVIDSISFPSPAIRPVEEWTDTTEVWVDMSLYNIINVDTKGQTLTTVVRIILYWYNDFAIWDPSSFCYIWFLYLTKEKFWRPDIYIYEMIDTEDKSQPIVYNLLTFYGMVIDFKMARLVISCDFHVYKFPFDRQTCNISLGSYVYPDSEIRFLVDSISYMHYNVSKEKFQSKGDWDLVNHMQVIDNYTAEGKIYSRVVLTITIQRVPQNYIVSFILPVCFMMLLDIASMFIEMPKNDRLGFKVSIVLGFSMLLLILNDILPLLDTPPLLGIFCCLIMVAMVVSIIESIFTSYILILPDNQTNVPHWVEIVFVKYLSRILCFKRVNVSDIDQMPDLDAYYQMGEAKFKNLLEKIESSAANEETEEVIHLKNLLLIILKIQNSIDVNRKQRTMRTEWSLTARVIDRLFFILYMLFIIVLCIFVFVSWKNMDS